MISSLTCRKSGQWYFIYLPFVTFCILCNPFESVLWTCCMLCTILTCEMSCGFESLGLFGCMLLPAPLKVGLFLLLLLSERVLIISREKNLRCAGHESWWAMLLFLFIYVYELMVESSRWTKGFPQLVSPIMFYLLIIKVNPSSLKSQLIK